MSADKITPYTREALESIVPIGAEILHAYIELQQRARTVLVEIHSAVTKESVMAVRKSLPEDVGLLIIELSEAFQIDFLTLGSTNDKDR